MITNGEKTSDLDNDELVPNELLGIDESGEEITKMAANKIKVGVIKSLKRSCSG